MFLDEFVYRLFPWRLEKLSQENLCFDNDFFFFLVVILQYSFQFWSQNRGICLSVFSNQLGEVLLKCG